jgi:hypothetical protein
VTWLCVPIGLLVAAAESVLFIRAWRQRTRRDPDAQLINAITDAYRAEAERLDRCQGGQCTAWDPHGDRPVTVFCRRHCPDCSNPLAPACRWHITAAELGDRILAGMPSEFSSLTDD